LRVLLVEDQSEVAEAISICLQIRWPEMEIFPVIQGKRAVEMAQSPSQSFDLVILDINLPDISGFDVLGEIRKTSKVPVIIVTVRGAEEDQSLGLEMGADDYIVKPFRARDLVSRVNAVLRRWGEAEAAVEQPLISRGKATLDLTRNEVTIARNRIHLAPSESRLLYILMQNADQTVDIDRLLKQVWGEHCSNSNLLRSCVRRLRDKLKDNPPQLILNEHGKGYRFMSPKE